MPDDPPASRPRASLRLIAGFGALAGVFGARRRGETAAPRDDHEKSALRAEAEALRDEIWELREAAAGRSRAEAANEAKSRFLATVSHEIRTPLTGVLGLANFLSTTELTLEQRSYVDAIATSGAALASLIDEILDFSKIEAGKLEIVDADFELAPLVEGVVELLAPRAQGKGIEIAGAIDPSVPRRVRSDPARIRQVLINLAGNAVKFTESGGVGLRVSLDSSGRTRFAVADTGVGVEPDKRRTIFAEFEQADSSSARRHEGAGLGLAISRRIAEKLGGELTLESSSPEGSVFVFRLPLRPAEAAASGTPLPAAASLAGKRALVVGASPFEAPFLGERLAAAGASVVRALGFESAMANLAERPRPDIVIVDCALGEGATRALADAARAAGVPRSLVLFSPFERRAFGQSIDGFDGWLVKPVRTRSLFERLEGRAASSRAPADLVSVPPRADRPLRVLLAEDNPINALIAKKHLHKLGIEATHVEDGLRAVERHAESLRDGAAPFDAMLVDIRMPKIDGLAAARLIRTAEAAAGARRCALIAFTANVFDEDRAACGEAGFDDFLTKPIDFDKLGAILARLARALVDEPVDRGGRDSPI